MIVVGTYYNIRGHQIDQYTCACGNPAGNPDVAVVFINKKLGCDWVLEQDMFIQTEAGPWCGCACMIGKTCDERTWVTYDGGTKRKRKCDCQ